MFYETLVCSFLFKATELMPLYSIQPLGKLIKFNLNSKLWVVETNKFRIQWLWLLRWRSNIHKYTLFHYLLSICRFANSISSDDEMIFSIQWSLWVIFRVQNMIAISVHDDHISHKLCLYNFHWNTTTIICYNCIFELTIY